MAEVTRVLREVQLDTEGRVVSARGSKFVKDDSAVVGGTKAYRKMARNQGVDSFIGVTEAGLGNTKAARTGMVKAASWSDFGICGTKPAAGRKTASGREPGPKEERKGEPAVALITRETVPQSFIDKIKAHPARKQGPLSEALVELYNEFLPEAIALEEAYFTRWNHYVDLEQDCLRQYEEKGHAEVGVDLTNGVKHVFILPRE